MNSVEYIGLAASLFILVSMCFPTNSKKGTILLRVLNILGSIAFVVYGALLPAISTAVLNGCVIIVNTVQLILVLKKNNKMEENPNVTNIDKD